MVSFSYGDVRCSGLRQVVQPQRWEEKCYRLLSALEARLGCLVGLNAYLTPKGTQGLAPHHDEVGSEPSGIGGARARPSSTNCGGATRGAGSASLSTLQR